jgi:spore coat polysaccharide biosynthesis protein SpsF (cytidylyltransferase family)
VAGTQAIRARACYAIHIRASRPVQAFVGDGSRRSQPHRWTVETPEDLEFLRAVYANFASDAAFTWRDVLDLLQREPQLSDLNSLVQQKPVDAAEEPEMR